MTAIKVAHLARNLNERIADPTGPKRATKRMKGAHDYLPAAAQLLNTSLSGLSVMVGASPSSMSSWAAKDEMPEMIFHGVEGLLAKATAGQPPLIETAALTTSLEAQEERNNATLASRISEAAQNGALDPVVAAAPPPAPPAPPASPAPVDAAPAEPVPMFLVRPCTAALAETVQRFLSALQVEFTPA